MQDPDDDDDDEMWTKKSKVPKMQMAADREEKKRKVSAKDRLFEGKPKKDARYVMAISLELYFYCITTLNLQLLLTTFSMKNLLAYLEFDKATVQLFSITVINGRY